MKTILVDDGHNPWVADMEELTGTLLDMGWTCTRDWILKCNAYWTEPDYGDDTDTAYADLCRATAPIRGAGTDKDVTEDDWNGPRLTWDGARTWRVSE